jgi:hypothetical protein
MNEKKFRWCACLLLLLCALALAPPGAGAQDTITAYDPVHDKALKNGVWMTMIYVNNGYTGTASTGSWSQPYKTIAAALDALNPATQVIFVVEKGKTYGGFTVSKDSATIWGQGHKPAGVTVMPHRLPVEYPYVDGLVTVTGSTVEIMGLYHYILDGTALTISGGSGAAVHDNGFYSKDGKNTGIIVSGGESATISGNDFTRGGGVYTAITLTGGSGTKIYGNTFTLSWTGINVGAVGATDISGNNFRITGARNAAIVLSGSVSALTVSANIINSKGYGVYSDIPGPLGTSATRPLIFTGNSITVDGTGLDTNAAGIYLKSRDLKKFRGAIYARVKENKISVTGDLCAYGVYLMAPLGSAYCEMIKTNMKVKSNTLDAAGIFGMADTGGGVYEPGTATITVHGARNEYAIIDADVVDDLAELNKAITSGETKWIYIKGGRYSGTVKTISRGVSLWGEGLDMFCMGSSGRPVFNRTLTISASDVAVMGLGFNLSGTTTGISVSEGSRIKIIANTFTGSGSGITTGLNTGSDIAIGDGKAAHKNVLALNGTGISILGGTTGITIDTNDITVTKADANAIALSKNVPVSILNNTISAKYCGIYARVEGNLTTGEISGNKITVHGTDPNTYSNGIRLRTNGDLYTDISKNTISSTGADITFGVYCEASGRIGPVGIRPTITRNIITADANGENVGAFGIYLRSGSGTNAVVRYNGFSGSVTGTGSSCGIYSFSGGTIVADVCYNTGIKVVSRTSGNGTVYGILLYGVLVYGQVNNNSGMNLENNSGAVYGISVRTSTGTIGYLARGYTLNANANSGTLNGTSGLYGIHALTGSPGGGNRLDWRNTHFTPVGGTLSGNCGGGQLWHNFKSGDVIIPACLLFLPHDITTPEVNIPFDLILPPDEATP